MDRSTGRVVVVLVPFFRLRCALAASLLAGGVESVSAALRLRRGRERRERERERERDGGGGGGDAEEGRRVHRQPSPVNQPPDSGVA